MAKFTRRFYKGHDNAIFHTLVADVYRIAEKVVERDVPVRFGSASKVEITLRATRGADPLPPDITFDTTTPPEPETFERDDAGNLIVRYGDLPNTEIGVTYEARIRVFDTDNPDGLVVASYGDDATNDTWELLCS